MTRAAERLFLCRAARRRLRGKPAGHAPSPFLAGIHQALTEVSHTRPTPAGRARAKTQLDLL